jgi:hypothetical protein
VIAAHVSGRNSLPSGGQHHFDISDGAASALLSERNTVAVNYVLLDINRLVLDDVRDIGPGSFFGSFGEGQGAAPVIRVGMCGARHAQNGQKYGNQPQFCLH